MPFIPNTLPLDFTFTIFPQGGTVKFPAYINAIGARFHPGWQTYKEIGRADSKVLYNEFVKEIDIDFNVVATGGDQSPSAVFNNLEALSKVTVPFYINSGYQGNFVRFTIGSIYRGQVGYVTNLQYNWENDKTSWSESGLPFLTRVNMVIAWVGKKMPQASANFFR